MGGVTIATLFFASPLIGSHIYARLYMEPPGQSEDCKSKSYPGSCADGERLFSVVQRYWVIK